MKREILFRGKRLDNGQWVYGDLYHRKICGVVSPTIHNIEYTGGSVDPATVGQYTGVVDKNGKKVFEDDIIGYTDTDTGKTKIFGVVKWYYEGNFYINTDTYCNYTSDNDCANVGYMMNRATTKLLVLGNIHDTPELLK
jgi:uncharacterized phage protein (TIGR01671 family)